MAHPTPAGPGALAWLPSSLPSNVRLAVAVSIAPAGTAAALVGAVPQERGAELGILEREGCLLMPLGGPLGGIREEVEAEDRRTAADPLKVCVVHSGGGGCRCGLLHQTIALRIARGRAQRCAKFGADTPSPRKFVSSSCTLEMLLGEIGICERYINSLLCLQQENFRWSSHVHLV